MLRRRKLWRWVKRAVYAFIGIVVVGGIVVAWLPRAVAVDLAEVTRAPMRVTVDEDGHARVKDRYVVSAPIVGNLGRIELVPGDDVKQGQALARIVPLVPPLLDERTRSGAEARVAAALAAKQQSSLQIERAQASLDLVRSELARLKQLAATGAGTRQASSRTRSSTSAGPPPSSARCASPPRWRTTRSRWPAPP